MKKMNDGVLNYEAGADLKCFFCEEDIHPGDIYYIACDLLPSCKECFDRQFKCIVEEPGIKCCHCGEDIHPDDVCYCLEGACSCEICVNELFMIIAELPECEHEEADVECHDIDGENVEEQKEIREIESA